MADRDVEGLLRWSLACMAPATDEGVTGDVPAPHRDGHQHDPEHHPGAGQRHDPGDDTDPAGRLIEAVRRLLEPD
jgi:hypothetical protein